MTHMTQIPISSLEDTLSFRSEAILDRFRGTYEVEESEAELFFYETKKWLWLCAKAKADRAAGCLVLRLIIDDQLLFIDEMWHNFILFTRPYASFCKHYLGTFIHHNPTPPKERLAQLSRVRSAEEDHRDLLAARQKQYEYIYDVLGADTLDSWYRVYGPRFTRAWFIDKRRLAETRSTNRPEKS